jgi:uncharacterized protein YoxC
LFDFITDPINTLFTWLGYGLVFGAFITTLLVVGFLVVIPIAFKLLGVYFARTIVIETAKVVKDLGIDKITKNAQLTTEQVKRLATKSNHLVDDFKIKILK